MAELKHAVARALGVFWLLDRLQATFDRHPRWAAMLSRMQTPQWMGIIFWIWACIAVNAAALALAYWAAR